MTALKPLVTLNVGPLYHGAPLSSMVCTHRHGGTFVTQRKFDAEGVLAAIQQLQGQQRPIRADHVRADAGAARRGAAAI